ncbi:hypothetical protein AHF37_05982 [Paragonimus kellicotti]|nr:hypothetical protein AHF37_05982 [Paragonimus kellicotti]
MLQWDSLITPSKVKFSAQNRTFVNIHQRILWRLQIGAYICFPLEMSTETNNQGGANGVVAPPRPQNKRLQQTQAQVDEVVDIMRVNMEKVLERDAKLSQLDDRADALQAGASQFEASAGKLKNKFWWKNMKMNIIIGCVVMVLVIAIG